MMTTETKTVTVEINDQAQQVLENMRFQAQAVKAVWERYDPARVLETAMSLASALSQLSSWGDAKVFKDDDLSLLVISPHITFGLIGHRTHLADEPVEGDPPLMGARAVRMGRFCFARIDAGLGDGGFIHCLKPVYKGEVCEDHDPLIVAAPLPMNWSYHS